MLVNRKIAILGITQDRLNTTLDMLALFEKIENKVEHEVIYINPNTDEATTTPGDDEHLFVIDVYNNRFKLDDVNTNVVSIKVTDVNGSVIKTVTDFIYMYNENDKDIYSQEHFCGEWNNTIFVPYYRFEMKLLELCKLYMAKG